MFVVLEVWIFMILFLNEMVFFGSIFIILRVLSIGVGCGFIGFVLW